MFLPMVLYQMTIAILERIWCISQKIVRENLSVSLCTPNNFQSYGCRCEEIRSETFKDNNDDDEIILDKKIQKSAIKCRSCGRLIHFIHCSCYIFCRPYLMIISIHYYIWVRILTPTMHHSPSPSFRFQIPPTFFPILLSIYISIVWKSPCPRPLSPCLRYLR